MKWTLGILIDTLKEIEKKIGSDASVDVLMEVNEPSKCQYQFPLNDVATSPKDKLVILMHEKWPPF